MKKLTFIFLSSFMTVSFFSQKNIKASISPQGSAWNPAGEQVTPYAFFQWIAPQGAFKMYTSSFNWYCVFAVVAENQKTPGTIYIGTPGQMIWQIMNNNQYQAGNNTIKGSGGTPFSFTQNPTQVAQTITSNTNLNIYGQKLSYVSTQFIQSLLQNPDWQISLQVVFVGEYMPINTNTTAYFYVPIQTLFSEQGPNALTTLQQISNISPQALSSWSSAITYQQSQSQS